MSTIISTVVFTTGQALAFNVVLPIWYLLMQVLGTV